MGEKQPTNANLTFFKHNKHYICKENKNLSTQQQQQKIKTTKMMYITIKWIRCILDEPDDAIKNYINF